ncbi:hypothetical protein MMC19_006495 [Ptychographa xylographoides]|nr:hypothetical protein [Ptychographa xylographoides]
MAENTNTNTDSTCSTKSGRASFFKEVGIDGMTLEGPNTTGRSQRRVRFRSKTDVLCISDAESGVSSGNEDEDEDQASSSGASASIQLHAPKPRQVAMSQRAYPPLSRIFPFTIILGIVLTLIHNSPLIGRVGENSIGVEGGVIRSPRVEDILVETGVDKRQNSPTDVCIRWAHQSQIVNGTIYIYGGQATQQEGQTQNTWNNDFLTLDVTKTWQAASPVINGLPQPSGPPAVALGYLWGSYDSLFLYGGEYSDAPTTSPQPFALWEYDIASSSWISHSNPQTDSGTNSDPGNQPVQAVAEGAGFSVPEIGRGWYFGGHQDFLTTAGWSDEIGRIYIKSMIEFTFPGQHNSDIQSLSGGQGAGSDGAWRNITQGGIQTGDGFPERADGVLVYVPGYGPEGILLGLAGGDNATFDQMNVIDVFDIASSSWYRQSTNGTSPPYRVDPCAVVASAADGSSTNVYMYGGQNLIPAGQQVQYDDVWILTIPSFTWIQADLTGQNNPAARAGHTCHMWDAQMIVVGGYVGQNLSCESPGIYVFDASELKWVNQFTSLSGGNTQNQQESQSSNSTGLSGSYGYLVPAAVQSIIGGAATGGATVTAPAVSATEGPLATGAPILYTVTGSSGATVTETAAPNSNGGGSTGSSSNAKSGPNIAAIVAGVVAGVLFIICCYLGFCAWVYRRQLQLYKNHVAMSQRAAIAGPNEKTAFMLGRGSNEMSSSGPGSAPGKYSTDQSSGPSGVRSSGLHSNGDSSSVPPIPGTAPLGRDSTANSSTEDLMTGQEPSFVGVLLNPRRSLRVINRD